MVKATQVVFYKQGQEKAPHVCGASNQIYEKLPVYESGTTVRYSIEYANSLAFALYRYM